MLVNNNFENKREQPVKDSDKKSHSQRQANNQARCRNGLLSRRPSNVLKFRLCFLYKLNNSHIPRNTTELEREVKVDYLIS